jgi:hypothetical protein
LGTRKSGQVAANLFTGSPLQYTVALATSYLTADYVVQLTALMDGTSNDSYTITLKNRYNNSFVINLNTTSIPGLVGVMWSTTPFNDV